jgi:hypothetical protein
MVERQNVARRSSRRRVGEFLAVGKNALELDIRVEVPEQDLRGDGRRERERRMGDEKNRRDERYADPPPSPMSPTRP